MLPEVMRAGRADLYSIFRTRVRNCAEALAVEDGSNRLTYAELHDRVDRLASVFLARGIAPGDRIAILSHNRAEYLELQLAAAGIGAIVACLNWRLAPDELRHCVELVEPVHPLHFGNHRIAQRGAHQPSRAHRAVHGLCRATGA